MVPKDKPGFWSNKANGLTLIELMVVVAIVAVLASLFLPVLSKAKYSAKNAVCRSNVRQQLLGLSLYADTHDAYPFWGNWQQSIYSAPTDSQMNPLFLCPLGKGYRLNDGRLLYPNWFTYSYNGFGVVGNRPVDPPLGLSGNFSKLLPNRPTKPAEVIAPSNLLAVGDAVDRSIDPVWDGRLLGTLFMIMTFSDQRISPPPSPSNPYVHQPSFISHRGRFNRGYSDGHLESEDFNKSFNASDDYLKRRNIDNEAHRDLWLNHGGF